MHRILCLSRTVPFEGVPTAGGQYLLQHLRVLTTLGHQIDLIAPKTPDNETAAGKTVHGVQVHLVEPLTASWKQRLARIRLGWEPSYGGRGYPEAAARYIRNSRLLEPADVVEFQWVESLSVAKYISDELIGRRRIVVVHDVLSEKYSRLAHHGSWSPDRAKNILRSFAMKFIEPRLLGWTDLAITFSEKDLKHLGSLCYAGEVQVVHPPLSPQLPALGSREPSNQCALFTANFSRPENEDAAIWLLQEIWPSVVSETPDARLVLAGAGPSQRLRQVASTSTNVSLTGYVDDLSEYYVGASVSVIPLRLGAGVKFKTIESMLYRLPVVTTPIGAEGVGESDLFVACSDEANVLAARLIDCLKNPTHFDDTVERAFHAVNERSSFETFTLKLEHIYQ